MTKPDNPAEPFKKALAEATKTIAHDAEMTVSYSVDPPGMTADTMRLPQVSRRMTRDEVMLARGTADAFALRHRFHDVKTHAKYTPQGQMARDLYEAMETARCEAVGAREMPGTATNIDAKIAHEADRKGYSQITRREDAPLATAAGFLVRQLATGRDLPKGAENVTNLWRGFIDSQAGGDLQKVGEVLADQAAFARLSRKVIADLGYGDQLGDDPDEGEDEGEDSAEEDEDNPDSQSDDQDDTEEADAAPEDSQDETQDQSQAQVSMEEAPDADMSDEAELPDGEAPLEPPPPAPHSDADPNYTVYRRSRTARGSLTSKKASLTPGGWRGWSRTRPPRYPSSRRRTPSSATRWLRSCWITPVPCVAARFPSPRSAPTCWPARWNAVR